VEEEIRVMEFLQGGGKGLHEIFRQVTDEPHRIGDNHIPFAGKPEPSAARVQGGKKPVFHCHVAAGQAV